MKSISVFYILTFAICLTILFGPNNAGAQNFTFSPSKTFEGDFPSNGFGSHTIDIVNQTTGSLLFKWKVLQNTFSTDWSNALCDFGSCYPVIPDSSQMKTTDPGGDAYFICYGFFNDVITTGILQLFVYEVGDETNGDTVTFKFTSTEPTGLTDTKKDISAIQVYPNPAFNTVYVDLADFRSISALKIYNLIGQNVWTLNDPNFSTIEIPIGDFKPGTYFIAITDQEGKQFIRNFQKLHY